MSRSVIVSYARTPFGRLGGSLKEFSAVDLGKIVLEETLKRANVDAYCLDLVIMGQVISAGCGQVPARQAALGAGIPSKVPCESINKVCASSLRAVTMADQIIRAGDAELIAAGGMESMSNAPYLVRDMRWGHKMFNSEFIDAMVYDGLWCPAYDCHMAVHGGGVALERGITREMQDEWALDSQRKALSAIENGYLDKDIIAVKRRDESIVDRDESPRKTTLDKLQKLSPIFDKKNTVTAGNAPGVNDGASALLVMDENAAEREGFIQQATILSHAMVSEDPRNIATAPGNAICKLLAKTDLKMEDIDLFEINEAFAAVALLSCKIARCDPDKVNVNGGAIAYGHPLGASGGRILMSLISELQRRNKRYGIAAICSGMGQGDAVLVENCQYKPI